MNHPALRSGSRLCRQVDAGRPLELASANDRRNGNSVPCPGPGIPGNALHPGSLLRPAAGVRVVLDRRTRRPAREYCVRLSLVRSGRSQQLPRQRELCLRPLRSRSGGTRQHGLTNSLTRSPASPPQELTSSKRPVPRSRWYSTSVRRPRYCLLDVCLTMKSTIGCGSFSACG